MNVQLFTEAADFKEYQKYFGKQFVALLLSEKSESDIFSWCLKKGFDLTKDFGGKDIKAEDFHFHTTVFYTSNEVYLKSGKFEIEAIPLMPLSFDIFGPEKNIPVIKLNPDASHIRDFRTLFASQGLQDSWPDWKPHLSLSYSYKGSPDIKTLEMPDFQIMADKVYIKKSS